MVTEKLDAAAMISPGDEAFFDNRIISEWIATAAAAAYLKISPNALRIMVHRGQVKAHKLGRRLRFRLRDLRETLQKRS